MSQKNERYEHEACFIFCPIMLPRPTASSDRETRTSIHRFNRRAIELWQAASLISAEEPGLLTASDKDTARRRGRAAGRRVLTECPKGKATVAYFRTLSGDGLQAEASAISAMTDRVWLLEDRCGLANDYLRAVADVALQHQTGCILCPNPLRRDQLEAVFLPGCRAAFLSLNAAEQMDLYVGHRVHLDRIPDPERKQALRQKLKENRTWTKALTERAAEQLRNAEILRDLKSDTCACVHRSL